MGMRRLPRLRPLLTAPRASSCFQCTGVAAMKVTVERAELLKSLAHVHRVVERRNTIPILANVLMRTDARGLALKATDLDIEIIETIPAEVGQEGATTVPAHTIYDIVRKLPEGSQVAARDRRRPRHADRARRPLALRAADAAENDFPGYRRRRDEPSIHAAGRPTSSASVDKTQFAISTEETRYYLNGIYLHVAEAGGRGAARGGHRRAPPRPGRDPPARRTPAAWPA